MPGIKSERKDLKLFPVTVDHIIFNSIDELMSAALEAGYQGLKQALYDNMRRHARPLKMVDIIKGREKSVTIEGVPFDSIQLAMEEALRRGAVCSAFTLRNRIIAGKPWAEIVAPAKPNGSAWVETKVKKKVNPRRSEAGRKGGFIGGAIQKAKREASKAEAKAAMDAVAARRKELLK